MGRDTIQLENVVSTISPEYLLEFTFEYGIPESLNREFPGREDPIVEFPEGKVDMDLFNLMSALNPTKVRTETRPRAAHKGGAEDQAQDKVAYEIPTTGNATTTGVALETGLKKEVAAIGPHVNKRLRKRGNNEAEENVPPKVLRRDHDAFYPVQNTHRGKSLASIGLDMGSQLSTPAAQDLSAMKSMSDPEPLSYENPQSHPEQDIAQSSKGTTTEVPPKMLLPAASGHGFQLSLRFEQEVRLLKNARSMIARQDNKFQVRDDEIKRLDHEMHGLQNQTKNLKTLLESEVDVKKVTKAKSEEKRKAVFEEFKKYEDDKVEQRCVDMDAHLDKLSVYFDEDLYPHMLTVIAGRRWVIGHGLRLAVMKCAESLEIRQAFADVVPVGLAKESDTKEDAPQWIRDLRPSSSQLKILVYPKIITACSSVDFQHNDFKALVYEYMPNGSVHDWLHSSANTLKVNLLQRVNILNDVATALDYLHNRCQTTIVHGDLKPCNILLDDDMVAHLGDFGLARLLGTDLNQNGSTKVKGTIGYAPPGPIPNANGNLSFLNLLYLDSNNLEGLIPSSLGKCKEPTVLSLPDNILNENIPKQIIQLPSLTIGLDLSHNSLSGTIPLDIKNLKMLNILYLSSNNLSDTITSSLGECVSLTTLNLRRNQFQGIIPSSLSSLGGLGVLDISKNNLSGKIPQFFDKWNSLEFLNLSFNDFESEVPFVGVFANASLFSVLGKNRLCGGLGTLELPKCKEIGNLHPITHEFTSLKPILAQKSEICTPSRIRSVALKGGAVWIYQERDKCEKNQERARETNEERSTCELLIDSSDERSTLKPATVSACSWVGGKHTCVDLIRVSSLVGLSSRGFTAGQPALKVASSKVKKHEKEKSTRVYSLCVSYIWFSYSGDGGATQPSSAGYEQQCYDT
nr:leucine-rich repeat protein [Tanacetum cinerariifolium]